MVANRVPEDLVKFASDGRVEVTLCGLAGRIMTVEPKHGGFVEFLQNVANSLSPCSS